MIGGFTEHLLPWMEQQRRGDGGKAMVRSSGDEAHPPLPASAIYFFYVLMLNAAQEIVWRVANNERPGHNE